MNTFMSLRSYGANAEKGNKAAEEEILRIEKLISATDPDSTVYKINNSDNEVTLQEDLVFLLNYSIDRCFETDFAFNTFLYPVTKRWGFTTGNYTVPAAQEISELLPLCNWEEGKDQLNKLSSGKAIDFGAVGKGFAGDKAIEVLKQNGVTSALLDLGGNIQLLGSKPDGTDFKIGLKNPRGGEVPVAISLSDCAVITSGGYERYFTADDGNSYIHIFDGRTGYPVKTNILSTTIISKKGLEGDFLSTASFILGKEWLTDYWNSHNRSFDFVILYEDNSITYSQGLTGRINLLQEFSWTEVIN